MAVQKGSSFGNSDSGGLPYLVYTATMGEGADPADPPIPTIMQNTIGNIVWSKIGTGIYRGTLAGAFTTDKTFCSIPTLYFGTSQYGFILEPLSENQISLSFYDNIGDADIAGSGYAIEVRVYP